MKKIFIIPIFLLFLASCLNDNFEPYDDTRDLAFLEEYRLEEGVIETNSGLLYKIIKEGEGSKPSPDDVAVFDLEVEHVVSGPAEIQHFGAFPLPLLSPNLVGLQEALQLMNTGSIYEIVLPSQLAWGDGRVYQFEVELHTTQQLFTSEYAQREDVTVTESGLYYRVIEEGDGDTPDSNSIITVNYEGSLISGTVFDDNENIDFNLAGDLIAGFKEGLQLMETGSTFEFLIPPDLGYGDQARDIIYPGAALLFEVELLSIQN